jgi:subtilase family serine protease
MVIPTRLALICGLLAGGVLLLSLVARPGPAADRSSRAVCSTVPAGRAACDLRVVTDADGAPIAGHTKAGYSPRQLRTAYGLLAAGASAGADQTIAVVAAYDDPTAEHDLAVYNRRFGLAQCSSGTGCFTKLSQTGTSLLPVADGRWALEASTDLQAAHAVCPNCRLLLVESTTDGFADLLTAEDYATTHATVVSNSWGTDREFPTETAYDSHFARAGIPITFPSGDGGYGVQYPAASPGVIAVGGTTLELNRNGTRRSEMAWAGAGSGCSAYEPKPAWQTDSGCSRRTVADVAADADPFTGIAVYDSTPFCAKSCSRGWYQAGGTSLAAPLVAAAYALAGPRGTAPPAGLLYATPSLYDVTTHANGTCNPSYLCTAGPGYDGPTGIGSPNGSAGLASTAG